MADLAAPVTLSRSNPVVKRLLAATFPNYRGRKLRAVAVAPDRPLYFDLHWSGGSRDVIRLVRVADGAIGTPRVPAWYSGHDGAVVVPAGHLLVVHSHFVGVDAGITVYVAPASDTATAIGAGFPALGKG